MKKDRLICYKILGIPIVYYTCKKYITINQLSMYYYILNHIRFIYLYFPIFHIIVIVIITYLKYKHFKLLVFNVHKSYIILKINRIVYLITSSYKC